MSPVKRIALTAGEPAGIGPDLCLKLSQYQQRAEIIVIADIDMLSQRAEQLGIDVRFIPADLDTEPTLSPIGELRYISISTNQPVTPGVLNSHNAQSVLAMLQCALDGCLHQDFDGVVTAPVHKGIINESGQVFSGHTEFFAEGADIEKVVMMLATPTLRVALATTHLPLKEVSAAINQAELRQVIRIINESLQSQFGTMSPRIAVCGLNPHAGENGYLGREEIDVIQPVIDELKQAGLNVSGAWPADTIFNQDKLADYDVVLAMYHDQGLPVLKHHGFGKAVNVTLGLPFIRTSVDHGTALDLAGTGKANASSLQAAIDMAILMASS